MPSESRLRQRFDEDALQLKGELIATLPEPLLSLDVKPGASKAGWVAFGC